MKRLRKISIIILIYISYCLYHNYFTNNSIVGKYVVVNQSLKPFIAETPYGNHNLVLKKDFTFTSTYWGNGTYLITSSTLESRIHLHYDEGRSMYSSRIKRQFFSSPRIILDIDMNHYMEKTD